MPAIDSAPTQAAPEVVPETLSATELAVPSPTSPAASDPPAAVAGAAPKGATDFGKTKTVLPPVQPRPLRAVKNLPAKQKVTVNSEYLVAIKADDLQRLTSFARKLSSHVKGPAAPQLAAADSLAGLTGLVNALDGLLPAFEAAAKAPPPATAGPRTTDDLPASEGKGKKAAKSNNPVDFEAEMAKAKQKKADEAKRKAAELERQQQIEAEKAAADGGAATDTTAELAADGEAQAEEACLDASTEAPAEEFVDADAMAAEYVGELSS
ncbi:hypothetical protein H9P43_005271 [Blastocladiella emersonii ATCC 22665]|nr:hypothetical protein H9P43_005271 [Blastocladiella emersonii ATCC 22665]